MNKRLSVGIVGAGVIASNAHLPALTNTPDIQIAWLADLNPERAATLAAAWNIPAAPTAAAPESLPSCDVVLLAIPVHAREPYLAVLRERGTAVLCEKPFAQNAQEHLAFCDGFPDARLGVGFQRRTLIQNRFIRDIVTSGSLGALRGIRVHEGGRTTTGGDGGYFLNSRSGRSVGVLADLGSHTLDMIFSSVLATGVDVTRSDMVLDDGVDRHVEANFTIQTVQGEVPVDYRVTWLDSFENAAWWEFEHATLKMGLTPGGTIRLMDKERPLAVLQPVRAGAKTSVQAIFLQWQSFLAGVRDGTASEITARSALWVTATLDALHDKAGRP